MGPPHALTRRRAREFASSHIPLACDFVSVISASASQHRLMADIP
jgi:hypothetical protein